MIFMNGLIWRSILSNSFILFCIFLHLSPVLSQNTSDIERLQSEKEDAIMEIMIKEKQREIEKEKNDILEEESKYNQENAKTRETGRFLSDFFFPGLGHFKRENYYKALFFGTFFWFGVYGTYTHYNLASNYSKKIESESLYNPLASVMYLNSYHDHALQTNLYFSGTVIVYLLNLYFSFKDEGEFQSRNLSFFWSNANNPLNPEHNFILNFTIRY